MRYLNESDLTASICRDSYYDFLQELWEVGNTEPLSPNWHIELLCQEMQAMVERVIRREANPFDILVNIPPGTTKSTICSVYLLPWAWTKAPELRAIMGSHTDSLSLDLGRKARDIVYSEKYKALFPEVTIRQDQSAKSYYANTSGGMRFAVGVGGSVIGMHGHILGIDDPIDPQSAVSEEEMLTVNRWCSETLPSRKVDKRTAATFMVMQRLHQADPSAVWIEKKKKRLRHICLPAELSPLVSPVEWRRYYAPTGLLDPTRMPQNVLDQSLEDLGQYGYSGQYGQNPVPLGGGMFKVSRMEVRQPPEKFDSVFRYWDKAATKDAGCFTAGVKMAVKRQTVNGKMRNRYFVLDVVRGQWASDEREDMILQTAQLDGPGVIICQEQEPGSSGVDSVEASVNNLAGFRVRRDKPSGDKVVRADTFSVQVNIGAVELAPGEWNKAYVDELRHFPKSKYKDQVDASSGAFKYASGRVIRVGGLL